MAARGETFFNGADGTIVRPQEEGGCDPPPPKHFSKMMLHGFNIVPFSRNWGFGTQAKPTLFLHVTASFHGLCAILSSSC